MSEPVINTPSYAARPAGESMLSLTHILYGLHVLSFFSAGLFSVVAMVINYLKRSELPDDFLRSHWRWQARSFWFTLIALAVTSPFFFPFVVPGIWLWGLIGLWYLYRFVRGWWTLYEGRPMPMPTQG